MSGKFQEFNFVEIGHWPVGGYMQRNQVYSLTSLLSFFRDSIHLGSNLDLVNYYKSVHRFDATFRDQIHQTGSTSGYEGLHIADAAVIEQDHPDKIIGASRFLFEYTLPALEDWSIDKKQLMIDPSGQKGFHIEIPAGLFQPEPHLKFYQIHREFILALLAKLPKDSINAGGIIDTSNYQINRLLRLRGTRNVDKQGKEDLLRGFKINLNGNLESLKDTPELVYELWKTPNLEGLRDEHITGEFYWEFKPIPRLVDLWQECRGKIEGIGKTKIFVPASAKSFRNRKNVKLGDMPTCIRALQDKMINNDPLLKGYHNHAVCALTCYYAQVFPDSHVHTFVNAAAKNILHSGFDQAEVTTTINSMLAGNDEGAKYPLGCGRDRGFPPSLFKWCSDSGELKDCPHHKELETKKTSQLISIADAKDKAISEYESGAPPYFLSVPELADFYGPLRPNDLMWVQALATAGKTRYLHREIIHAAPIAKKQGDVILLISPEDTPEEVAERFIIRQAKVSAEKLFATHGQVIPQNVHNWFDEYRDHIYTWRVNKYNVAEMAEAVERTRQLTGKPVVYLAYDGITYLRGENRNARILEADIAQEIARTVSSQEYVRGIFAVHISGKKFNDDARKSGKDEVSFKGGQSAAYGTGMYFMLSRLMLTIRRENGFVLVNCEKAKRHWKDKIAMPEEIVLCEDRYLGLHTTEEAKQMPVEWFEVDPRMAPTPEYKTRKPADFKLPKNL